MDNFIMGNFQNVNIAQLSQDEVQFQNLTQQQT